MIYMMAVTQLVSQNNALLGVLQAPPRHPSKQLHTKTGIDWLDVKRAKMTCVETYKCLHELHPQSVNSLSSAYAPVRPTRLGLLSAICCLSTRTRHGEINFPWRAHHYWSTLPNDLHAIPAFNAFKDNIKKFGGFIHLR